jgi:hypothetical protein
LVLWKGNYEGRKERMRGRIEFFLRREAPNEKQGAALGKGELREILYTSRPAARIYTGTSKVSGVSLGPTV